MAKNPVVDLGGDGTTAANAAFSCRALHDFFEFTNPSLSAIFHLKPRMMTRVER